VLPDGTRVSKGWRVMYAIYAVGRMTKVWGADARDFRTGAVVGGGRGGEGGEPCEVPGFQVCGAPPVPGEGHGVSPGKSQVTKQARAP